MLQQSDAEGVLQGRVVGVDLECLAVAIDGQGVDLLRPYL